MKTILTVGAVVVLIGATLGAASAGTAMYHSEADDYYGWAAGYTLSKSEVEAEEACSGAGGAECRLVLECADGFGSVAFAGEGQRGAGFSCGLSSALYARIMALATCAAASNTACWTESTFDGSGNELAYDAAFDTVYYSQQMLFALGYEPGDADGKSGPQTREAAKKFQAASASTKPAPSTARCTTIWWTRSAVRRRWSGS